MLIHMQMLFLKVPYAQMKVTLVLMRVPNETNVGTNECLFSVFYKGCPL